MLCANIKRIGAKRALLRHGWDGRTRTYECQSQSLVPYHLATSQYEIPAAEQTALVELENGVSEGTRTLDLQSHNLTR